ncbi:DUF1993 domain-containing protein [Pontixanthobacter aquaemixtae]|uniref:DUF1993 family protein n=1 Tax=Pontixanthobacter aquaemixtae TaxID=1958940 RepID=A0A844ZXA3_9SPHN|nr:DUF1993 domain-containing protein [Pontixanthobacter aquaemixtae]MXO91387.1 DUF1993 family protein [Pontixanthobacter aquaemixtae]
MTLYDQTIAVYRQSLKTLSGILDKAAAHEKGPSLLEARLAEDMHPLATQIRFVGNLPGEAMERLTGRSFTSREENDTSFADAKQALADIDEFLASIEAAELKDAGETMVLDIPNGMEFTLKVEEYVRDWSIPNFYFHLTTAYAILRSEGVELGKADFMSHMFKYVTKGPDS